MFSLSSSWDNPPLSSRGVIGRSDFVFLIKCWSVGWTETDWGRRRGDVRLGKVLPEFIKTRNMRAVHQGMGGRMVHVLRKQLHQ